MNSFAVLRPFRVFMPQTGALLGDGGIRQPIALLDGDGNALLDSEGNVLTQGTQRVKPQEAE